MGANITQETIDELTDQILAKIMPALNDNISQAVTSVLSGIIGQPIPDIGTAQWIWTHERQPPVGPRAFRKVVAIPESQYIDSMLIDIAGDGLCTLWVNEMCLCTNFHLDGARRHSIQFPRTNRVLIVASVSHEGTHPARFGFIASAVMWDSNTRFTFDIVTDASWTTSPKIASVSRATLMNNPAATTYVNGFEKLAYRPDSSWTSTRVICPYGAAPWDHVLKPTVVAVSHYFPRAPITPEPDMSDHDGSVDLTRLALLDGSD